MIMTQNKITSITNQYLKSVKTNKELKEEYGMFLVQIKKKIEVLLEPDKINSEILKKPVCEYPETLYELFVKELDKKDWDFFNSKEGIRWFIKKYPQFKIAK